MTDRISIVVPTADRQQYLAAALDTLVAQRFRRERFEIVVVDDSPSASSRALVVRYAEQGAASVRYAPRRGRPGLNAARNTGIEETVGEIVAFVDDDCRFEPGWLEELARGIEAAPAAEAFGGPVVPELASGHPRWCGREPFPITTLDRGPVDRYVDVVYGANMAVRRSAFERIGLFDAGRPTGPGDETEWLLRLRRQNGLVRYVAKAGVRHSRLAEDVTLRRLLRAAWTRARHEVVFDRDYRLAPRRAGAAGKGLWMAGHALRRHCWAAAAHSAESFAYVVHSLRPTGRIR